MPFPPWAFDSRKQRSEPVRASMRCADGDRAGLEQDRGCSSYWVQTRTQTFSCRLRLRRQPVEKPDGGVADPRSRELHGRHGGRPLRFQQAAKRCPVPAKPRPPAPFVTELRVMVSYRAISEKKPVDRPPVVCVLLAVEPRVRPSRSPCLECS